MKKGKRLKFNKSFKLLTTFVLLFCVFFLASCVGGAPVNPNFDFTNDELLQPSSDNLDDFYSRVLLLTDPGHAGIFYDNMAAKKEMTFKELLDRQITTFSEHIVYSLNYIYGDHASRLTRQDLHSVSDWGSAGNIFVDGDHVLTGDTIVPVSTINFSNAAHQSAVAEFGGVQIVNNPFNYDNAISGGYKYHREDDNTGYFTTQLNTTDKWQYDGQLADNDKLKNNFALILFEGSLQNIDSSTLNYEAYLENIDHLGFTSKEIELFKRYIKEKVIGDELMARDLTRKNSYADDSVNVNVDNEYTFALDFHHFKNYDIVVDMLINRAVLLTSNGNYGQTDGNFSVYPPLARIKVDVFKPSDITTKMMGDAGELDSDLGTIDIDENPVFDEPRKLLSFIFLPKVSQDAQDKFKASLDDNANIDANDPIYNQLDMFSIGSFLIGVQGSTESDYVNDYQNFIVKYSFYINIDGEVVYNDYIENNAYTDPNSVTIIPGVNDNTSFDYFPNDSDVVVFNDKYSAADAIAEYNMEEKIKDDDEFVKISEYSGVQIVDENDNLSEDNFYVSGSTALLNVWNNVFDVVEKVEGRGVNANFRGEKNFWQVFINYFQNNAERSTIDVQYMWLMSLFALTM